MDQVTVKGPARLVDTHVRAIHQDNLLVDGALEGEGGDTQLGIRPRHVRVVPGDPGNLRAVRGHRGSLREVGALEHRDDCAVIAGGGTIERNGDDLVHGFARS